MKCESNYVIFHARFFTYLDIIGNDFVNVFNDYCTSDTNTGASSEI